MTKLLGVLLAALALVSLATPSRAADPVTRTVKSVTDGVSAECRRLQWPPHDACTAIGGIDVSEARMRAYEQSWVHKALTLQRKLDDTAPFLRELIPHTHNSFNSSAYPPTVTQLDPNQLHSMRDQLRMDMRGIEMDIHKWPHLDNPRGDISDVVLCHGEPTPVGPIVVHVGCSVDRPFTDGLAELRGWLDEPANAGEIVLLYLENNLDGDPAAHDKAVADLQSILGNLVYRPPANKPCAPMPMGLSRAAIRAAGKRVLIVGNCGPGAWGSWVHERGPQWDESSSADGDDYPDYPACLAERAAVGYASHWIRRYEDSTWLSAITGGGGAVTATETRRMVRCGVNMPGFDQLYPDDPRLAQLVWSWAPNEPAAGAGSCAVQGPDARFHAASCVTPIPWACVDDTRLFTVAATCPAGTRPGVPANGYENERLREAKAAAGATTVRLAL
ncbi:MAG TPA: hypothetical protein VFB78_10305 [Acidimicrobiales bacterium]|nr:hypothetical protein [Acidimicrobiales bacterium]